MRIIVRLLLVRSKSDSQQMQLHISPARTRPKGQMMNNLMFYPFVTGSISVIFARYKRRMRGVWRIGEDQWCPARYRAMLDA